MQLANTFMWMRTLELILLELGSTGMDDLKESLGPGCYMFKYACQCMHRQRDTSLKFWINAVREDHFELKITDSTWKNYIA